jgi:hypothetical protein
MLKRGVQILYENYPSLHDPELRRVLLMVGILYLLAIVATAVAELT